MIGCLYAVVAVTVVVVLVVGALVDCHADYRRNCCYLSCLIGKFHFWALFTHQVLHGYSFDIEHMLDNSSLRSNP